MYEVDVDYKGSFNYQVRSEGYSVNVAFSKKDEPANGITPPALLLAAVGSCLAVYLERYLTGAKIAFKGFSINLKSDICKEPPHFMKKIDVKIGLPDLALDDRRKKALLDFTRNCPVHNTLLHAPEINIEL